jgi:membrane protease YdiL (CAAX protease family)
MAEGAEEAPAAAPPRWGLGDAVLAFMAGLLGTFITVAIFVGFGGETEGIGVIIAGLIGLWGGMGGVTLLASKRKGTGDLAADFGLWMEPRDVLRGLIAGVACNLVLVNAVVILFQLLGPDVDVGQQSENVTADASGWRLAVLAPFLIVGAPLIEELYFRGLLQRSLIRRFGPIIGIAGSALAFGLVHASSDLDNYSILALVAALASFGVVLGWLAHRYGRLGPGLVAHATFNLITVVALALS